MDRRWFLGATGGAIAALVAGCSGDGDGGGADTATSTQTETPTQSPSTTQDGEGTTAQDKYPDYNWEILDDAEPVGTATVTMRNTRFNPLIAAVTPGTDVTFQNEASFGHTVTIPRRNFDREVEGGQSITVTFDEVGTYDYVCTVHPPEMLGRIEVTENPPQATTSASGDGGTTTETAPETTTETSDGGQTTTDDGGGYY